MRTFINETAAGVFDPETVNVMAGAFDAAWKTVISSGAPFADERYRERVREIIARHIIQLARLGGRDQKLMADDALLELAHANLKPEKRL
jgi:hypothetical protein